MAVSIPPKGDAAIRVGAHFTPLEVSAQTVPDMTVRIEPGSFWTADRLFKEYGGGNSTTLTAATSSPKLVVIGVDENASINVIDGVESSSPCLPVIPANVIPLAFVFVTTTTTSVTSDTVFDIRPLWQLFTETVPNLAAELAARPTFTDMNSALALKADTTGTPSATWCLNDDHVGAPTLDGILKVERGSSPDVSLRWNETTDVWEFTNDGSTFFTIGASAGDFYTKAELDGGVLDTRYYTETESDALFATIVHTHVSTDITDFTAAVTALFTAIALDDLSDVVVTLPADTEVLMYNGADWVNKTVSLEDLGDVALSAPTTDHVLIHNGASDFVNMLLELSLISDFDAADFVHTTGVESIAGAKTFTDDMVVSANLDVTGDITGLSLELNSGEIMINTDIGGGGDAGIEIDRGGDPNALFYFDETADVWIIGVDGDVGQVVTGAHTHTASDVTDFSAAVTAVQTGQTVDVHSDVSYPFAPVPGQFLKFIGAVWENTPLVLSDVSDLAAALPGAMGVVSIDDLGDVIITGVVTSEVLRFDGSDWVNEALVLADVSDFTESDYVHTTGVEVVGGAKTFSDDIVITGNLTVNGTTTTVDSTVVTIADNVITLNSGEAGAGVTGGTSGIEVDRGSEPNALMFFDEPSDKWRVNDGTSTDDISVVGHTHLIVEVTDVIASAAELNFSVGVTSSIQPQIDGKAASVPGGAGNIAELDGIGDVIDSGVLLSAVSLTGHVHDATDLTTGVLADARVQESNVTQHEAALSITESQISDLAHVDAYTKAESDGVAGVAGSKADKVAAATDGNFAGLNAAGNLTDSGSKTADFALASHTHVAADVTDFSTAADARIALAILDDLADASVSTAVLDEFLRFDGVDWVNETADLDDLSDVTLAGPVLANVLRYNGAVWSNAALLEADISDFGDYVDLTTNQVVAGEKTFSDNATFSSDVTIVGDLTVSGTTTSIETVNMEVEDKNIVLNAGFAGPPAGADGGGLTVVRDSSTPTDTANLLWDETAGRWKGGLDGAEENFVLPTDNSHPDYELIPGTGGAVYVVSFTFTAPAGGKAAVQVFRNGIKQIEGALKNFTITAPSTVTFTAGSIPVALDDVEFYGFG